jgi:hypothetical protein
VLLPEVLVPDRLEVEHPAEDLLQEHEQEPDDSEVVLWDEQLVLVFSSIELVERLEQLNELLLVELPLQGLLVDSSSGIAYRCPR